MRKMKFIKALTIGAVSLNITACGIFIPMSNGDHVDLSKLDTVKVCETTKSEVVNLLGEPTQRGSQSGYNTMTWSYSRVFLMKGETQHVVSFFDKNNTLVDYTVNPVGLVEVNNQCK
jgi:outer membrane protein assembly factor BamE (lipoprotein component of BamABCDE complex)